MRVKGPANAIEKNLKRWNWQTKSRSILRDHAWFLTSIRTLDIIAHFVLHCGPPIPFGHELAGSLQFMMTNGFTEITKYIRTMWYRNGNGKSVHRTTESLDFQTLHFSSLSLCESPFAHLAPTATTPCSYCMIYPQDSFQYSVELIYVCIARANFPRFVQRLHHFFQPSYERGTRWHCFLSLGGIP